MEKLRAPIVKCSEAKYVTACSRLIANIAIASGAPTLKIYGINPWMSVNSNLSITFGNLKLIKRHLNFSTHICYGFVEDISDSNLKVITETYNVFTYFVCKIAFSNWKIMKFYISPTKKTPKWQICKFCSFQSILVDQSKHSRKWNFADKTRKNVKS